MSFGVWAGLMHYSSASNSGTSETYSSDLGRTIFPLSAAAAPNFQVPILAAAQNLCLAASAHRFPDRSLLVLASTRTAIAAGMMPLETSC